MHHLPLRLIPSPPLARPLALPLRLTVALILLAFLSFPAMAAVRPVAVENVRSSQPLMPFMERMVDPTGKLGLEEVFSPSYQQSFQPLDSGTGRQAGTVWLRIVLAARTADTAAPSLILDLGDNVPGKALVYLPKRNTAAEGIEWQQISAEERNIFTLPDPLGQQIPIYIKLDGLPGPWFAPVLRTPHNVAVEWDRLARPGIIVALCMVMLLSLLRGFSERGEWRIWTSLFSAAALAQAVGGIPSTPAGFVTMRDIAAVLSPGFALMLLPHVGRHLLRTRETAPGLDTQYLVLSLPGAALALVPLMPGLAWTAHLLPLWPLSTIILLPTTLVAIRRGIPGSRRFFIGCLAPVAGTAISIFGLASPAPASVLATGPLWGLAFGAMLIAATGTPAPRKGEEEKSSGLPGTDARTKRNPARVREDLLDPLAGEPGLRLISPAELRTEEETGAMVDLTASQQVADPLPSLSLDVPLSAMGQRPANLSRIEEALRDPLERMLRGLDELGGCALPPLARNHTEVMAQAGRELTTMVADLSQAGDQQSRPQPRRRAVFDLQRVLREAHDAVADRAEERNLALSWFMSPHLAQLFEGDALRVTETIRMLAESSVRATERGSVQLSVRRVPESVDPGHLLFTVADTGTGTPPERRSILALARAWELAVTSGGALSIDSGPQGTTISFSVRLTALSGDLAAPRPAARIDLAAPAAAQSAQLPLRVIICDDVPSSRHLLSFFLEGLPHETLEARSATEAADIYRRAPSGLVIFDADMPEDDIVQAVADIRNFEGENDLAPVPVLALTSHEAQVDRLQQAGCNEALSKPVTRTGLRDAVLKLAPLPEPDATAETMSPPTPFIPEQTDEHAPDNGLSTGDVTHSLPDHGVPDLTAPLGQQASADDMPYLDFGATTASHPADGGPSSLTLADDEPGRSTTTQGFAPADTAAHHTRHDQYEAGQAPQLQDLFGDTPLPEMLQNEAAQRSHLASPDTGLDMDIASLRPREEDTTTPSPAAESTYATNGDDAAYDANAPQDDDGIGSLTRAARRLEAQARLLLRRNKAQDAAKRQATLPPLEEDWVGTPTPVQPARAPRASERPNDHQPAHSHNASPMDRMDLELDAPRSGTPTAAASAPLQADRTSHYQPTGNEWVGEPTPMPRSSTPVTPAPRKRRGITLQAQVQPVPAPEGNQARHSQHSQPDLPDLFGGPAEASPQQDARMPLLDLIITEPEDDEPQPQVAAQPTHPGHTAGTHGAIPAAIPQAMSAAGTTIMDGLDDDMRPFLPGLVSTLEEAMQEAHNARNREDTLAMQEASARIAGKAETFGLHVLGKLARCMERAAAADDMDAVQVLFPDLEAAVRRNLIELRPAIATRTPR